MQSDVLHRPARGQLPSHVYEDIYDQARSTALLEACSGIDKYDPQRCSFVGWVQFLMKKRFLDFAEKHFREDKNLRTVIPDLALSNNLEDNHFAKELREYLELDPDSLFRESYIRGYPQASFQAIALRRIEGQQWREISEEFGLPSSTLSSYYQRCLQRFIPQIRNYLQGS